MALVNGQFFDPTWVALIQSAGRGVKPVVTGIVEGSFGLTQSVWTKGLDQSSGGPYVVVLYYINPAETEDNNALRIVVDGTNVWEQTGMNPTGSNFLIGTAFDEQIGDPTTAAVWCHTGFELWGYKALASSVLAQSVYYTLEWVAIYFMEVSCL